MLPQEGVHGQCKILLNILYIRGKYLEIFYITNNSFSLFKPITYNQSKLLSLKLVRKKGVTAQNFMGMAIKVKLDFF